MIIALVSVALGSAGCIGVGPQKDRLYVNEWKAKRTRPIQLQADWKYQGEHWEHGALNTVKATE